MGELYRATLRGESPRGVWHEPGDVFEHEGTPGKWMEPAGKSPLSDDLPALSNKTKAELLEIAAAEGVEVADDATNAQIVEAIEAKRAA